MPPCFLRLEAAEVVLGMVRTAKYRILKKSIRDFAIKHGLMVGKANKIYAIKSEGIV